MSISADLRPRGLRLHRPGGDAAQRRRRFLVGAGIALAAVVAVWLALLLLGGFGVVKVTGTPLHSAFPFGVPHLASSPPSTPAQRLSSSIPSRAAHHHRHHPGAPRHHGGAAGATTRARHHAGDGTHHRSRVHWVRVRGRTVIRRWIIPARRVTHPRLTTHRSATTTKSAPPRGGSGHKRPSHPSPNLPTHYSTPKPAAPAAPPPPVTPPTTSTPTPPPTTTAPAPSTRATPGYGHHGHHHAFGPYGGDSHHHHSSYSGYGWRR